MPRKLKTGLVVSDKMQKTIVVEVTRTKMHPLYKKYIRLRKKFMVHDATELARQGDLVKIEESRPISRHKCWVLKEILREAPGRGVERGQSDTGVVA